MATRSPKVLCGNALLTTSAGTYYSVPSNTVTTIAAFTINNTSGAARTFTLYLVPSGASPAVANQIVTALVIPAGASTIIASAIGQSLAAGATIQMFADANAALSVYVSGYETA